MKIDASGVYYRDLNKQVREAAEAGEKEFDLVNVNGQRYIAGGLAKKIKLEIHGVPGNDLAAFMNGPSITVHNNAQDACANTMNDGKIQIHGHAGDVLGYAMRGGRLHVLGDVGYRVGIHMKSYKKQLPVIIAGGVAGDFFGEYMAGGMLVLLGLERRNNRPLVGDYCGTGMHGGVIYVRGEVEPHKLGKEVGVKVPDEADLKELSGYLKDYCADFGLSLDEVMSQPFSKLVPVSSRPYGRLYAY